MPTRKITTENYEEFFLLYADGELLPGERKEVELFLEQHPDLQIELDVLMQTILQPDTSIQMEDKSNLFRHQENISDDLLITYLDGELKNEHLISSIENNDTPAFQERLRQFRSSYSKPDESVVFSDKTQLYRHEKVRYISLKWVSVAAAIAVAACGMWWFITQNRAKNSALVAYSPDTSISDRQQAFTDAPENNSNAIPPSVESRFNDDKEVTVAVKPTHSQHSSGLSRTAPIKETVLHKEPLVNDHAPVVAKNDQVAVTTEININKEPVAALNADVKPMDHNKTEIPAFKETPAGYAKNESELPEKKSSFFKKLANGVKEKVNNVLPQDGETVIVAGFAIN